MPKGNAIEPSVITFAIMCDRLPTQINLERLLEISLKYISTKML